MSATEQYECGNCYFVGSLGIHGGCGRCGSQAVLSLEKVGSLIQEPHHAVAVREMCGTKLDLDNPIVVARAGYWLARCQERDRLRVASR